MTTDLPAVWRDFEEAVAVLDAAPEQPTKDGLLPDDDPHVIRFYEAQRMIINARPPDLAGIAVQIRYHRWLSKDSDPSEDVDEMYSHAVEQLVALAAQQ